MCYLLDMCRKPESRIILIYGLQWCHNGCNDISNHMTHDCLLNCLSRRRTKKTSKLCVSGLCEGNAPVTCEFPTQRSSNMENVSIWWHHDGLKSSQYAWSPTVVIAADWDHQLNSNQEKSSLKFHKSLIINQISWIKILGTRHIVRGMQQSVTCEFPTQRSSNMENVSIWWRHDGLKSSQYAWSPTVVIATDWDHQLNSNQEKSSLKYHKSLIINQMSWNKILGTRHIQILFVIHQYIW